MDDIDRTTDVIERANEQQRRMLAARASRPPRVYDCCRSCGETLQHTGLRAAGFCDVACRDDYELNERVARINGRRP